ncbi:MAG: hypothetical protein IIC57_06835 [Proteobacteria bacterium]|nr:hypothetical protein [Pseudomonadota bacterium]
MSDRIQSIAKNLPVKLYGVGERTPGTPGENNRSLVSVHWGTAEGSDGKCIRLELRGSHGAGTNDGASRHHICSKAYLAAQDLTTEFIGWDDSLDFYV